MIATVLHNFHFLRPAWLFALLPLLVLLLLLRQQQQGDSWQHICDPHLLPHLLVNRQRVFRRWPFYTLALAWIIAVCSLAGPTWQRSPQAVYKTQQARIIILDLSPSMYATDLKPSRIARARYKILDILKRSQEGQMGMVVFSSEAYTVSPLTNDAQTIAAMVPSLDPNIMPVGGSNIAAGLEKAEQLFKQADSSYGSILLLTDSPVTKTDLTAAQQTHQQGYDISILGVGTPQGSPIPAGTGFMQDKNGGIIISKLNSKTLAKLANVGGGTYTSFTANNQDIDRLLRQSTQRSNLKAQKTKQQTKLWKDQGYWLVLLLLPLALLAFRRGWLGILCE